VKYDTAQRLIEKALSRAAGRAGISREELEEMSVPDYGLGPDSAFTQSFGECSVRVSIEGAASVAIEWFNAEGRALQKVPASVKEKYGTEWKDLQKSCKEMEKMLAAHRVRIERLLLTQRAISIATLKAFLLADDRKIKDQSILRQFPPEGNG
jgi:hypothetical protein